MGGQRLEERRHSFRWGPREYGVFAALVVSGVLWMIGVVDGREVYPAPVLPSFGGVPDADRDEATMWEVLVSTPGDGEQRALSADDLFSEVPDSQWDNLFNSTLDNSSSSDVAAWIVRRVEEIAGVECSTEILVRQVTESGNVHDRNEVFRGSCS